MDSRPGGQQPGEFSCCHQRQALDVFAWQTSKSGSRWRTGFGLRPACSCRRAEGGRAAPVVLEALPYRKDDATASYRPEYERLCAEYGYAVARVDLRGTGSSKGWPPTSTGE
jgi:hypothetical protein